MTFTFCRECSRILALKLSMREKKDLKFSIIKLKSTFHTGSKQNNTYFKLLQGLTLTFCRECLVFKMLSIQNVAVL